MSDLPAIPDPVPALTVRRLALADVLAIVAFTTVGQLSHHGSVSIASYAHDALPLLGCWLAAGSVLGLYGEARSAPRAFALTWLIGVTSGVLIRAAVLGRHLGGRELGFLITSLVFVLLFVLGARALAHLVVRRPRLPQASSPRGPG